MNEFLDPCKGSTESIDKFSVWLKETYGGYNVLVNNAGIASELNQDDRSHIDKLVDTVNTNFSGTAYVSLGLMSLYGRSQLGRPVTVNRYLILVDDETVSVSKLQCKNCDGIICFWHSRNVPNKCKSKQTRWFERC